MDQNPKNSVPFSPPDYTPEDEDPVEKLMRQRAEQYLIDHPNPQNENLLP